MLRYNGWARAAYLRLTHGGKARTKQTIVALARKLLVRCRAMLRDHTPWRDRPRKRRLTARGVVELSSATGYYGMRAFLLVDDHPYYTRTDAQGRFQLDRVPPGRYEVVCWHPSWIEQRHDRDPETSLVTRIFFRLAEERTRSVELAPRGTAMAELTLSSSDFDNTAGLSPRR